MPPCDSRCDEAKGFDWYMGSSSDSMSERHFQVMHRSWTVGAVGDDFSLLWRHSLALLYNIKCSWKCSPESMPLSLSSTWVLIICFTFVRPSFYYFSCLCVCFVFIIPDHRIPLFEHVWQVSRLCLIACLVLLVPLSPAFSSRSLAPSTSLCRALSLLRSLYTLWSPCVFLSLSLPVSFCVCASLLSLSRVGPFCISFLHALPFVFCLFLSCPTLSLSRSLLVFLFLFSLCIFVSRSPISSFLAYSPLSLPLSPPLSLSVPLPLPLWSFLCEWFSRPLSCLFSLPFASTCADCQLRFAGDLHCFGRENISTPHVDSLATDGLKMTQFLTAGSVCSALPRAVGDGG